MKLHGNQTMLGVDMEEEKVWNHINLHIRQNQTKT